MGLPTANGGRKISRPRDVLEGMLRQGEALQAVAEITHINKSGLQMSQNVALCRTNSKTHGLAAARNESTKINSEGTSLATGGVEQFRQEPTSTNSVGSDENVGGLGGLSRRQVLAVQLLSIGRTVSGTASVLGIERRTVQRWKTLNPTFAAELERRQREMYESAAGKIRMTLLKSLAVIDQSLHDRESGTKTALKFVGYMDVKKHLTPPEPRDREEIADEVIRRFRRRAGADPDAPISPEERDLILNAAKDGGGGG